MEWMPWEGAIGVEGSDGQMILWTTSGRGIPPDDNAALIVAAVNAYYGLRQFKENQTIHWPMEIERRNRELAAAEAREAVLVRVLEELYEFCRGLNEFRPDSPLARRVQTALAAHRKDRP